MASARPSRIPILKSIRVVLDTSAAKHLKAGMDLQHSLHIVRPT